MCVSTVFAEKAIAVYGGGKIADVSKPFESFYYVLNQNPDSVCQELFNTSVSVENARKQTKIENGVTKPFYDSITYKPARKVYEFYNENSLNYQYKLDYAYACSSASTTYSKFINIGSGIFQKYTSSLQFYYGPLTVQYYCPSRHKIPTNSEEYINFPMADDNTNIYYANNEIDKNGDCIEVCPAPVNGQRAAADCTQTVSLTPAPGQAEPRPKGSEGGDGKSTYDLIAKVTEGNKPKAGMALTFAVEVEAGSGGLPKTPVGRPAGNLNIKSGTTNASGEVKVTFTSPIFAGTHKVKVSCAKCTGTVKEAESKFNVKVPNLSSFPADTKVPARWNFIGTDKYHNQERFYLTDIAKVNLIKLVDRIQLVKSDKTGKPWGIVGLNDANLPWGGRYNGYSVKKPIPYRWNAVITNGFHEGHRLGVEIDIRTSDKLLSDTAHVTKAFNEVCKDPNVTATILNHYLKDPHFHAYLLGNVDKKLGGSPCWQSAK